jgi:hypothetical protein
MRLKKRVDPSVLSIYIAGPFIIPKSIILLISPGFLKSG